MAAVDVSNRVSGVAAAVDGAVVREVFADEVSGVFVLNEAFASEEALVECEMQWAQPVFDRQSARPWASSD